MRPEGVRVSSKAGKYKAKKTEVNGIIFDSKKEADRWIILKTMEADGEISDLKRQVVFYFQINGLPLKNPDSNRKLFYKADFTYIRDGGFVVEDSKGYKTDVYVYKKSLMFSIYNIKILET